MPAETQLRIANCLLAHLIQHHPTRHLPERLDDIRHWLDMAAEQMRGGVGEGFVGNPPSPASPVPGIQVSRAVVDRNLLPPNFPDVRQWRAARAKEDASLRPTPTRKKPTLH
ncbi:hypothetical protein [Xanthomonas campestris]|uniref:hypothetical protein n=1 Tax=Xanthomonas campestris TaxID=339 RepID=UPI00237880F8|nr:hypothetical protein [Xanthomonas campestris]WDJ75978.1 hypothetical protein JH282_16480 [Xanthomonas campestris pv. campestris]